MKRPEYVAIATRIYRAALDGASVTRQDMQELARAFSREGFTQGYYEGRTGRDMFGTHQDEPEDRELFARARATYENQELQRVPVRFHAEVRSGFPARLTVRDAEGREAAAEGPVPENARTHALTPDELTARLEKTGGTPYQATGTSVTLDAGLSLPVSSINTLRREALSRLTALRARTPVYTPGRASSPSRQPGQAGAPVLTAQVRTFEQITPALLGAKPEVLYVPLAVLSEHPELRAAVPAETALCAVLPRVIWDAERDALRLQLRRVWECGVREVLAGNLGHIALMQSLRSMDFAVRGDFGLNLFNSRSADFYAAQGLRSVTASFELTLPQIRDLTKPVPTEILAYGRLPLMVTENCVIKNRTGACSCDRPVRLCDRRGESFPVLREIGSCRSEIFNSKKLYLLDKRRSLAHLGLWALRLSFTTEHPDEIAAVLGGMDRPGGFDPGTCTRGLYVRGVE